MSPCHDEYVLKSFIQFQWNLTNVLLLYATEGDFQVPVLDISNCGDKLEKNQVARGAETLRNEKQEPSDSFMYAGKPKISCTQNPFNEQIYIEWHWMTDGSKINTQSGRNTKIHSNVIVSLLKKTPNLSERERNNPSDTTLLLYEILRSQKISRCHNNQY